MPVRHRSHFTAPSERKKCPPDLEGKLRNPLCRKELSTGKQGPSGYGPIPPGPKPHPHPPPPPPPPPPGDNGGITPGDVILPIVGAGLTGYGAYRARRALRKIQNNRRLGRDWRGRQTTRYTRVENERVNRPMRTTLNRDMSRGNVQDRLMTEPTEEGEPEEAAGSRQTRSRELRQAREVSRSRPNQSSIMDEEERPNEFRQARSQEARTQPRRSLRARVSRTYRAPSRPSGAFESEEPRELRPVSEINFRGGAEGEAEDTRPSARSTRVENERVNRPMRTASLDDDFFQEPTEETVQQPEEPQMSEETMEESAPTDETFEESMRPVSLEDAPDNPSVQQQWQRSFRSRLQRAIRRPPAADPERAETQLRSAQEAETSAEGEVTEADATMDDIDDAVQQSRAQLERQQNELRQTRSQLEDTPEENRPADLPDETYDEAELDAQAQGNVAGEEGQGLEDAGDVDATLEEGGDLEDTAGDAGDVGEVGADVAEGAGEAAEVGGLEEAAGEAELIGGGPEDPIGDVVAGALAVAGAFVAIGQWFSGLFHHNPSWHGVGNASQLKGSSYTKMLNNLDTPLQKAKTQLSWYNMTDAEKKFGADGLTKMTQPRDKDGKVLTKQDLTQQIKAIQTYKSTLEKATSEGRQIVSYHKSDGTKAIAVQLSKKELANAIHAYSVNPDVYKGWDKNKLTIMGLNPNMSQGKAGATKTGSGMYVPTKAYDQAQRGEATWSSGAGGGNWTYFYLSRAYQDTIESKGNVADLTFGSVSDLKSAGDTPAQKKAIAQGVYMAQLQRTISSWKGDTATLRYLKYVLADFKYKNGFSSTKPTVVPVPVSAAGKAEMAKLQTKINALNTKVATADAELKTDLAKQAKDKASQSTAKSDLTNAQNALTQAQQAQAGVMTAAKAYDTNLASTLTSEYQQEYYQQLESSIQDNTSFNPAGLINPTVMYNQNYVKGTGVSAPKSAPVPTGIEFVNGVPQILASAFTPNPVSTSNTPGPTTGTSTTSSPSVQPSSGVVSDPTKPAVPAKVAPPTTGK